MTRHRRPRLTRSQQLTALAAAALAAFWHGATYLNVWTIIGSVLLAGAGVALSLDSPEDQ